MNEGFRSGIINFPATERNCLLLPTAAISLLLGDGKQLHGALSTALDVQKEKQDQHGERNDDGN